MATFDMRRTVYFILAAALLTACGHKVPGNFWEKDELPTIYPDYCDVTVPVNIAPLTFRFDGKADDMVARLSAGDVELVLGGDKIQPDADDWHELIAAALKSHPSTPITQHPSPTPQPPSPNTQPPSPNTQHPSPNTQIKVEVYVEQNGSWSRYKPFSIFVSPDSIDPYISYRLIPPSYVTYEELTINQRCLENYDETVIYDNMLCSEGGAKGQCINCHNYQQFNPDRMQFHARQNLGGTVIAYDGKVRKINMRNESILSAGVYPAWHPWLPLIVYSTNMTGQIFHSVNPNKIEVFDSESDLIAYDVEKNEVTNIENDPNELECFPHWAPDGRTLYYCSAHFEYTDSIADKGKEFITRTQEAKYKLYRKSFDPETLQFGSPTPLLLQTLQTHQTLQTLPQPLPVGRGVDTSSAATEAPLSLPEGGTIDSPLRVNTIEAPSGAVGGASPSGAVGGASPSGAVGGASATLPRVSPDGRFLMFTVAPYGIFHIWHHDADLWLLDLQTGEARCMEEINSPDTESYHSWSSNGRWVVFSSRRYDGNYTRPFIAHIDADGRGSKPFELPCADPDRHRQLLKSYNVPEFMRGPVTISPQQFADILKQDGEPVKYVERLSR